MSEEEEAMELSGESNLVSNLHDFRYPSFSSIIMDSGFLFD